MSVGTQKQTRESKTTTVNHTKSQFDAGNVAIISDEGKAELEGVDAKVTDTLLLDSKTGIVSKGVMDTRTGNQAN